MNANMTNMTNTNKILSIIAYYLSEYDMQAVKLLGYKNRSQAFSDISLKMNHENNYLKLRRDEFDALPQSSSHRNGWKNRSPSKDVIELSEYLGHFSFDELTNLVKSLINNEQPCIEREICQTGDYIELHQSESTLEEQLNQVDSSARIEIRLSENKYRVYDKSIIVSLKKLYQGKCQICGCSQFNEDITEAHHIEYFSRSCNNNAQNIIILCPNHHRLIHKLNPIFVYENCEYIYPDGSVERLKLNKHLGNI